VSAVRTTTVLPLETGVQTMLRRLGVLVHGDIEAAEPKVGGSDLDEQGLDRLDPSAQVEQSPEHQISPRKGGQRSLVHGVIIRVT